jgi:hypothetical protein
MEDDDLRPVVADCRLSFGILGWQLSVAEGANRPQTWPWKKAICPPRSIAADADQH